MLSGNAVFLQKQKFLHLITLDWAGEMPLGVRGDSKVCGRMCPLSLPSWNVGRVKPESFSESTWNWALQWHSANRPVGRELPTTGAWAEEAVSPNVGYLQVKRWLMVRITQPVSQQEQRSSWSVKLRFRSGTGQAEFFLGRILVPYHGPRAEELCFVMLLPLPPHCSGAFCGRLTWCCGLRLVVEVL